MRHGPGRAAAVLSLVCLLAGCAYVSHTVIDVEGDNVHVPVAGISTIGGDKVTAHIDRKMVWGICIQKEMRQ